MHNWVPSANTLLPHQSHSKVSSGREFQGDTIPSPTTRMHCQAELAPGRHSGLGETT